MANKRKMATDPAGKDQAETSIAQRHVVIGDLHLRRTDPLGIVEQDGLNTRLKDKLEAFKFAVDYAIGNNATHIDLLGDAFEAVNPPERLKRLFWNILAPAIHKDIQITIIIGNHDTTGEFFNFDGDTMIVPMNVNIVHGKPLMVFKDIMYVPYTHKDDLLQGLNEAYKQSGVPKVIFGHFEIEGAELAPDNTTIREGLDRESFKDIPIVWLGHIHKHQTIRDGMAYIGSCVQCDFGEVNNIKVFGVLDIHDDWSMEQKFVVIPQRSMYQISIMESDPDNLYLASKLPENLKQPGVLLKFILEGSEEWVNAIDKSKFRHRFPDALRVQFDTKKWDTDREKTELVTTNMTDRVHAHVKNKAKGKDHLEVGLLIAKEAMEVDL